MDLPDPGRSKATKNASTVLKNDWQFGNFFFTNFSSLNFQPEKFLLLRCAGCFATNQKHQNRLGFDAKNCVTKVVQCQWHCQRNCIETSKIEDSRIKKKGRMPSQNMMHKHRVQSFASTDERQEIWHSRPLFRLLDKVHKGQQHERKSKSYLSILTALTGSLQVHSSFHLPSIFSSFPRLILLQTRQFVSQVE